jgi:integrase
MGRAKRIHFTEDRVRKLAVPKTGVEYTYDEEVRRLAVAVYPSGRKVWKFVYTLRGKARFITIDSASDMTVVAARNKGHQFGAAISEGRDPQRERIEHKRSATFGELVERYFKETNLKSHAQTKYLLTKYVPKNFNEMLAGDITRADVRAVVNPLALRTPANARQTLAAISAVFGWAVGEAEVLSANPCWKIKRAKPSERSRVLAISELPQFWEAWGDYGITGVALKVLLITGQRPGEVAAMHRTHLVDGWWEMPGEQQGQWPGTKNARVHRIFLPQAVRELIAAVPKNNISPELVFDPYPNRLTARMQAAMREISAALGVERATPHDLRRTHGTTLTRMLGFGGRHALNVIQNHITKEVASVYDRYSYGPEVQRVMELVAAELLRVAEKRESDDRVVALVKPQIAT